MKRFLLFVVASLLFVACDNKFEDEANSRQGKVDMPKLTAGFAEDTRTYVEDGFYLRWHEGDLISAFVGNTRNSRYVFEGNTGDKSGTFGSTDSSLGSSKKLDSNYALYPYDKGAKISTDGVISCSLPAVQEYAEESFGKGANTMVAVTKSTDDTLLAFKNACGYLKVKLYGKATVKSIELKGNNGEKIAGAATITAVYGGTPTVAMAEDATESITLDCGEGVKLSTDAEKPTEFWFVVPPTEFSKGITISVTNAYNAVFEKSTSNKIVVERNIIQPMSAVEVESEEVAKPANNEIWYTSSDGEIVKPSWTNVFGANIVSNNYKDGKGVITFDGDVTTIGDHAFWDCYSLTSVTIGDSVTTIGNYAFDYCTSLTSVTIPDSVTTIGHYAFLYCDSLTSVYCKATTPPSLGDDAFKYYDYSYSISNSISINIGCTIYVPRGCGSAYKSAHNWSDYAADIVEYDFETGEVVPEGQHNNEIWYTSSDGKIVEPYNGSLNNYADAITTFGANIVSNNYNDGKGVITFDGDVTTIGERAFRSCESLTSVTIGDSVTTIGYEAFWGCDSLTSVTIGDSVTTIGERAFYYCDSLTSVTIPDSVTTIGNSAFSGCTSLTSVYCKAATPPSLGDYAFKYYSNSSYINIGCTIYVPRGCGSTYKSATRWSNYAADIVEYDF